MSMSVFVVVPTASRYGIVFGKNSNRSAGEVQELVYEGSKQNSSNEVQCSFISVPAVAETASVILSKPAEIWGCEMGANEHGVVGGTVPIGEEPKTGLLPQDLLRLALERSNSSETAVDTIGSLLNDHATGKDKMGFVLGDKEAVWYLEAVGKAWVAQKINPGVRVFPSSKRITTDYQKSAGWTGEGTWCDVFLPDGDTEKRIELETKILDSYFSDITDFGVKEMTRVLRDTENSVSRSASDLLPTAASQVSIIPRTGPSCHWFTATPDPTLSVFKPFIFTPSARISSHTRSPETGDRQHTLYKLHATATGSGENKVITLLQEMEGNCLNELDTFLFDGNPMQNLSEADDLLKDCVEAEVRFYK